MHPTGRSDHGVTVAEAVFAFMRQAGIDRIFGNPGSTELPMFVDLPKDFDYVLGLQESIVIGMADAYAQITDNAAFVNLHSAAGLGHAMGNLYTAFRNRAPLIVSTGQQVRELLPGDPFLFNEAPAEMAAPYVKWAVEPARAEDVPAAIQRAYFTAMTPPRGPVLVSVPLDDWARRTHPLPPRGMRFGLGADPERLAELGRDIDAAQEVAIVVGPGVDADRAWREVQDLAEKIQAKVWVAPMASRAGFPENHQNFAGFLPARQPALSDCLSGADLVLVLGAPVFTYHFPGTPEHLPPDTKLWLVTDDPRQAAGALTGTAMLADIRLAARGLAANCSPRPPLTGPARHVPRVAVPDRITDAYLYQVLTDLRDPGSIVVEEAPTARDALHDHFPITRPAGFFATASGGLGYGLPAAVGAALTRPGKTVIAPMGDGSSMYSIQALWSAAEHDADVFFVILNNGGYGALKGIAKLGQGRDVAGCEIGHLDFVSIAQAQGVPARRCDDPAALPGIVKEMLAQTGPRLLEVIQTPPAAT
ncbi:benzoylformate decarboxylase [Mesobaculum littorinae]|uniref:Benzoylformate decarboxylase n=1 Tax=Mesobaculum littorinae TaxID=2486419 RepID=A0A438AHS9_9RHOB|nr:benzoylformate decarboxylase [Mesobaculum littorinae]